MKKSLTLMQGIRECASKLKGCQLKKPVLAAPVLKFVGRELGLESTDEVVMFVALFDRQCAGMSSALDNLSTHLDCSPLDIMQYVPAINSLIAKGYAAVENKIESLVTRKYFMLCPDVLSAVVEGRKVEPEQAVEDAFDQFDFCEAVNGMLCDRSMRLYSLRKFFANVEAKESEHASLPLVANLKDVVGDIESRAMFYKVCYEFVSGGRIKLSRITVMNEILYDIYDRVKHRAAVKAALLNGSHPLIAEKLVFCSSDENVRLTRKGVKLLYGEHSDAVLKQAMVANRYEFVKRIDKLIYDLPKEVDTDSFDRMLEEVRQLEEDNDEFSMVRNTKTHISDLVSRIIFYDVCKSLVDSEDYPISNISYIVESREYACIRHELKEGTHQLVRDGIAEVSGDVYFDCAMLELTEKGKELFFEEDKRLFETKVSNNYLIQPEAIGEKQLFFDENLSEQLSMLSESLAEDNYLKLRQRLDEHKLPKGVAVLLYGKPGTGKTETAMQIARQTHRAVMHVDISATKSCWFGESEKLIKGVFTKYRRLCENSKSKPILLFNEADAVFSKRKDSNASNVAQIENAIQNIILEEMEQFDGILIATTNLASNFDKAFERRFLFKIKYDNPIVDAKAHIWQYKLPQLSVVEARQLAASYDFSGGEIENVVRKLLIEEVVRGKRPTMQSLMEMCAHEKIAESGRTRVGF